MILRGSFKPRGERSELLGSRPKPSRTFRSTGVSIPGARYARPWAWNPLLKVRTRPAARNFADCMDAAGANTRPHGLFIRLDYRARFAYVRIHAIERLLEV